MNAILGIIVLFFLNFLHVMQWMGKPDLGTALRQYLYVQSGTSGVCILVLLNILGITSKKMYFLWIFHQGKFPLL